MVSVTGFSWCKHTRKDIGLGSLTANHLCRQHNSDLSPLDQAGKDGYNAIRDAARLGTSRGKQRPRKWNLKRLEVDGPLLERWFLKTGINLSLVQQAKNTWHLTGANVRSVPDLLVRTAFGLDVLSKPMGLYVASKLGEEINFSDYVSFGPVLGVGDEVVGFSFTFQGMRFLLWIATIPVPDPLILPNSVEPEWSRSGLVHHAAYLRCRVGSRDSHYIDFGWPGRKVPTWVYCPV